MSTFEVRSYFINVGVGDCAIHLIIENKTKIFASTLFDGGLHTAADLIKENIQRLGEKFNTTIKFDSIVVTHWDEDHYVGTMQMLLSDLHQNIKNTRKQESSYIDPKKTVFYYPMAGLNKTMKASNYDLTDGFLKLKWVEEGQMVTSDRLCAARGSIKCLGYDLFHTRGLNAQPLQYGAVPSLDSVCKTKQCFASTPSPCPIFLVVGIDTFFINDKNAKEVSPAAVFDDLNETSLMAAVIWPSEDNSTKPRVSLFTGGDASEAEEVRFLQWAGEDSIIEAIKAGHHGSHFSTHEDLFKHGLRSLIISAGESHGHPSFSLTYFAMVFMLHMYDAGNAPTFLAMRPPYWLTKYGGSKETARTVEFNIRKVLSYEANALHVALEALTEAGIVQKTLKSAIIHVRNWAANDPITKLFDSIERDKVLAKFPNRKLVLDDKMFPKPLEFKDKKNGLTVHGQAEAEFLAAEQEVLKFMKGVLNRFCIPKPANTSKRQQKQTRFIEVIASSSDMKEKVVKYPDATQVVAKQAGFWNRNRSRTDYGDISKKLFGDGKTGTPVKPLKKYAMGINLEEDSDDDDEDDEANKKTKKKELRKSRAQRGKRNQTKGDNIMFFTLDAPNNILMAAEQPAFPDTTADAAREKELIRAFFVDVDASDSPPPATRSGSEPGTLAEAWFRDCIGASSIIIDKSHDSGGLEAASKITIMGPQSSQQTNNSSKVTTYSFTTDKSVRETQFNTGGLVGGEQTTLGYDPRTDGLILGLETLENFTFSDLLTMIQYSAQPWIKNLLDAVPLAAPKPGSRSGLWLQPDADMYTVLRVQTSVSDLGAAEKFADLVKKITCLDIHSIDVVGFTTFDPAHMIDETVVMVESKVSLHVAVKSAATGESSILGNGLAVVLTSEGVEFTVQLGDLNNPVESTLKWLNNRLSQLNSDQLSSAAPVPVDVNAADPISSVARQLDSAIRTLSSNFKPRRIQMAIGSDHKLTHFSIDIQSGMERGALPGKHVPILFSIYWTPGQLNIGGQIWSQSEPAIPFSINPFKEDFLDLKFDMTDTVDGISIPLLINSDQPIIFPTGIPSIIKRGSISLTVTDGSPIIKLEGSAVCDIPDLSTDIPTICLDSLDLKLQYQASKDLFIQFRGSVSVDLSPDHDGEYSTIGMRVLVAYEKSDLGSQWRIIASAKDIQFAGLFSFFREDGSNYSLTDFMSNLAVPNVEVEYVYTSKQPSQLSISGSIKLGPILLGMSYKQKKGEEWTFEADVRPDAKLQQTEVTMKSLLSGLVNDLESIPEFVTDLTLSLSKVKGGIKCYSVTQKALKYSVFSLQLDVGDFSFTFAQIQRYDTFTKTAQMKPPTRILRFGISGFPETDVKVVGNFKLPFDELDVLWVSADLTQPELEILNQKAFAGHSPLLYQNNIKADPKEGGSSGKPKVLLQSGCHFQVLLHESSAPSLVLDYAFHKSKQGSQTPSGLKPADPSASPASSPPSDSVQGDTAVAPLTKTVGPVSVRSIGVKATSANKIVITIDASVTLGPVGLALLGFAVGLDFAAVKSPSQLMRVKPDFGLDGMAVAFDRPPIRLAGVFSKTSKTEGTEYRGGITISVGAWSAMAVGAYEELQTYKSLFVFGILSGPLVEFGCAEINGVAGGFGYNSHLGLPEVDHVATFPLVAMNRGLKEPKGDIMLQLVELTSGPGMQCITPQKDSLWLAAGISIKAFQMLDVLAVIALDLSSDPKFGLIAEATAIIPKGADREKAFVVLELDLIAVVDPGHGLLTVSGQLTPRSFILSPTCKVSGGFCMAYFFEGSGHEGDWVLSIGGYHPSFQPPAHYPPTPPRLGISWVYDNELSITGEAYFAITPNACMGGGRLDAIFCTGRTKATFSAYANFLMYFRPFHFQSEIGVNVYASSVIGWGFLSKEISLEISAMLELHGPPIAGVAHLHFWFLDVSVRFGPDSSGVPKLTTSQFLAMIKQASTEEEAAKVEDHLFSIQRGAIANGQEVASQQAKKDPTLEEHLLRATQLQLNIQSRFPILTASCNNKPVPINNSNSIFISPMQIANPVTTSTFKVTITELDTNKSPAFSSTVLTKNVPSAIWKKYEGELNPGSLGKSTSKAFAMGLVVEPEKSTPSNEGLAAFSVIKFSSESILHPVPDIKALEKSQMIGSAGQQSSQDDAQARQRVTQILGDPKVEIAQQKVLDCWSRFRAKYTGGGRQFASSDPTPSIKAFMPKSADAMLKERFTHALPVVFG